MAECKHFKINKIEIIGILASHSFQRAKTCAVELHTTLPLRFPKPIIKGLLEVDWNEKLLSWRRVCGKSFWCLHRPVAVFIDGHFIGDDIDLLKIVSFGDTLYHEIPRRSNCLKEYLKEEYYDYFNNKKRIYCFLDICIDDAYIGTLTFELFSHLLPRTCENFKSLCVGDKGNMFSYKETMIHRVVKKCWIQGGDTEFRTGGGGTSIYCPVLEDENYAVSHNRRGVLSMANNGKHSNGSQFIVTLQPSTWMDRYYVAFGQLIEGVRVLNVLENLDTFYERPLQNIVIKNCGELNLEYVEGRVPYASREPSTVGEEEWKQPEHLETLADYVLRLVMEAVTAVLAIKENMPDTVDKRDVSSFMDLQYYFEGFYSISDEILEDTAQFLRKLRRAFSRHLKPNATEVVETLMYDLLLAVSARMRGFGTTLDDIRVTLGEQLYNQLINGIDMEVEVVQKFYVGLFIDQLCATAETIITILTKKLESVRERSKTQIDFEEMMQTWVRSFVVQETWKDDKLRRTDEPSFHESLEGVLVCSPVEPELSTGTQIESNPYDPYVIKARVPDPPNPPGWCPDQQSLISQPITSLVRDPCEQDLPQGRIPFLEFVDYSRFKLRQIRGMENKRKPCELKVVDRKVKKWLKEVIYIPETEWIRDMIFDKKHAQPDHMEEIIYGSMSIGLLEIYFLMNQHINAKTSVSEPPITPPEEFMYGEDELPHHVDIINMEFKFRPPGSTAMSKACGKLAPGEVQVDGGDMEMPELPGDDAAHEEPLPKEAEPAKDEEIHSKDEAFQLKADGEAEPDGVADAEPKDSPPPEVEVIMHAQTDRSRPVDPSTLPSFPTSTTRSFIGEQQPSFGEFFAGDSFYKTIDIEALLAQITGLEPEKVEVDSFGWMEPYIVKRGDSMKADFAAQVHRWLEGESFCYNGFIKSSHIPRASLFSTSLTLAGLIMDNDLRVEIKEFVYDLWELYLNELYMEELPKPQVLKIKPEVDFRAAYEEVNEEEREMPPDSSLGEAFWVKFLTEVTKQALGKIAKLSRLPRRLYLTTDSEISFEDKMKEWFEFNTFNPPHTKPRHILEYLDSHHTSLENLDATARSFLKKKVYAEAVIPCKEWTSADYLANETVMAVIERVMKQIDTEGVEAELVTEAVRVLVQSSSQHSQSKIPKHEPTAAPAPTENDDSSVDAQPDEAQEEA